MICVDTSVILAHLLAEDRSPHDSRSAGAATRLGFALHPL
jgi:hypothetical protein